MEVASVRRGVFEGIHGRGVNASKREGIVERVVEVIRQFS